MGKFFLGLDPGKSGALASINSDDGFLVVHPWPGCLQDAWELLAGFANTSAVCALEKVHSMPRQGVKSMFTFGQFFGRQEAMLAAAGVAIEYVLPSKWQTALGCLSGGDKKVTWERARLLFPQTKITQQVADAVLLAEYARRTF